MYTYICPDSQGWVNSLVRIEGPEWDVIPPGWASAGVPEDVADQLHRGLGLIRRDPQGKLRIAHDDRSAWHILASTVESGAEAVARCRELDILRDQLPDWETGVTPWTQPPPPEAPDAPLGPVPGGPPDLTYRVLQASDLDALASVAVESGIYPAQCPPDETCGCRPPEAHAWLRLARRLWRRTSWPLVLEWRGTPLQVEQIDLTGRAPVVVLTFHFNRERPHWFWREAERPVLERLQALGYTELLARTRKDRPDWIAALQRNYGATVLGEWDQYTARLQFPLATALSKMKGWPARPTAPIPGLQEITPEQAEPLIEQAWGPGHPRLPLAKRLAHEWYHLDRAAILAAPDGIRVVRVRDAEAKVASIGWLTPMRELPSATPAVETWMRAVGFARVTAFVPAAQHRVIRSLIEARGARTVTTRTFPRGDFVEITRDL